MRLTAQVDLPCAFVTFPLPSLLIPQVDLEVNPEIIDGERSFFASQVLQEDAVYSVYVICCNIPVL